jgi:hypothetical protein
MTADTPQHNGVAESLNRRLMERTRAILHHADLPKYLWAEAIQFAVWLKNRTSTKMLGISMPHERLYSQKPNLGNVPEWGQTVWVYNPDGLKLDTQLKQARWVGYDANSMHAHCIYWSDKNSITVEHNVKFILPTVVVNTLPPSYASTMIPVQALPAAPHAPPTVPTIPVVPPPVGICVTPAPQYTPPVQVFHPPPDPALPSAPSPTPTVQACDIDEDENEVEKTITCWRYAGLTARMTCMTRGGNELDNHGLTKR